MENETIECKTKKPGTEFFPKNFVKVEAKFYDGTACDFTITVKDGNNGMFYGMAKMFAGYFACLKIYEPKHIPGIAEKGIANLNPLAVALFRELCKHDYITGEEHGEELLKIWTNQSFELLQSGHGIYQ